MKESLLQKGMYLTCEHCPFDKEMCDFGSPIMFEDTEVEVARCNVINVDKKCIYVLKPVAVDTLWEDKDAQDIAYGVTIKLIITRHYKEKT